MSGDIAGIYGGQAVDTTGEAATGRDFEPIPPGWYPAEVEKAEIKETRDGQGKYLWVALTIVGENYGNRKLFPRINLVNASEKAVEIGRRELNGLAQACEITALSDSGELVGKYVDVRVKIRPAREGYEADNEVTAYAKVGTKSQEAQASATPASPPKAAAKPPAAPKPPPAPRPPAAPAPTPAAETAGTATKGKMPWEK